MVCHAIAEAFQRPYTHRMGMSFDAVLEALPRYRDRLAELSEIMLANLVMIAETPAPTFAEQRRMEFVLGRLDEYQLLNCSTDEVGNGLGILVFIPLRRGFGYRGTPR